MLGMLALAGLAAAAPPSMEEAVAGWLQARAWLDAGSLPAEMSEEARIEVEGADAVGVILRMDGRSIGRGDDPAGDDRAVRRALGRALAQAFGNARVRDLPATIQKTLPSRLALEVEFAVLPRQRFTLLADAAGRPLDGRSGQHRARAQCSDFTKSLGLRGEMGVLAAPALTPVGPAHGY